MSARRSDRAIALLLALGYVPSWQRPHPRSAAPATRAPTSGADSHLGWFQAVGRGDLGRAFDPAFIRARWSENREHPVLMKSLSALSRLLLHDRLRLTSYMTAGACRRWSCPG